ncbi:centromere protein H [Phaethornis superciliosus]
MEGLSGEPDASVRKVDVLMLLRLRDQMKQQLRDCSTAADTNQESDLDHVIEEGSTTKDLEKDIEEKNVSFQNKTLALQRIQIMLALRNKLNHNDSDSREILKMLKHIVILSQKVIECQKELITIIQNIFQNIIIGSRVNWAEDPSLRTVVLKLEKNVFFP